MEACMEKPKGKKHRLKSESSKSTRKSIVSDKNKEIVLKEEIELKVSTCSDNLEKLDIKNSAEETGCDVKYENKSEETHHNVLLSSTHNSELKITESKAICNEQSEKDLYPTIPVINSCVQSSLFKSYNESAVEISDTKPRILQSEKHLIPNEYMLTKDVQPQNMYPDLKSIQLCEQMHSIICSQTLFKTFIEDFQSKTVVQANESFLKFVEMTSELDRHPLWDMIHQYRKAKYSCIKLRSRMKYLNSDLKRKKDSLWKSVKKEVSAKGKCDDGSLVHISHSYVIKELDQDKFEEVVRSLKEVEESVSSDAFNFYLEELSKLRIDNYLSNLVEEHHMSFENGFNKAGTFVSIKKCISILFDCLRQNAPDKDFIQTCQKWLNILVSKLLQNKKFDDNIFIINHVIRCPSGIENWATQLVQVPFEVCENEKSSKFGCSCCQKFLLVLYLVLHPVPQKDFFLKHLKDSASSSFDMNFTVLDSDGEEEEVCEIFKNWSEGDILSLLSQIPIRNLYRHLMLDHTDSTVMPVLTEEKMLKMFAFSSFLVDILFKGMETYCSEEFTKLFESISNLIRHILVYVSDYWAFHLNNSDFRTSVQAVYERFFFHIIFQVYSKKSSWRILSILPYEYISKKMLWNILWIFFSPGKSEEEIYSEKDVERKIQDSSMQIEFINHPKNVVHMLYAFEKIALSTNMEEDFLKFLMQRIFQLTFVEETLRDHLAKEGCVVLSSILHTYPHLISILIKEIDANDDAASFIINLFKTLNLLDWIPEDSDVSIISSWLLSNPLSDAKSCLARLILSNMNWEYTDEGLLVLPQNLHNRVAMLVTDAYCKFDSGCNEWVVSRGIKQILQFTAIMSYQRNGEGFVQWAWNILFSLKLHPLDRKHPPWIFIYDGYIDDCDKFVNDEIDLTPLMTAFQNKHPSGCYLKIVMTDVGHNMKNLMDTGIDCFSSLVENEQYMVAIHSLYYILPFFVKNAEHLLDSYKFLKALNDLITADMTYVSSIFGEAVIGAVLQNIAAMIKYQIYQASERTVECAAPLLKLWIKILIKILHYDKSSKNKLKCSAKQIYFLLDVLVKLSYLHGYTRECTLDLLSTFCNTSVLHNTYATWKWIFSTSTPMYAILNKSILPEYPWLAWFVLLSEMKQKNILSLWEAVQNELVKKSDSSVSDCLKRACDVLKIDQPPLDCLPIYRWARQAIETAVSHPISPLLWQQFFLYFFQRAQLTDSLLYSSIGMKYFKYKSSIDLMGQIKKHLEDAEKYYRDYVNSTVCFDNLSCEGQQCDKNIKESTFHSNVLKLFGAFKLWINDESLHDSNLCLSALEPKYCPDYLERILRGDQSIWFDMVSETCLKIELEQKIQSWYKKKCSSIISEIPCVKKESLSQLLLKHLENYDDSKDFCFVPVSSIAHEINLSALSSTDELVQLIEKNQTIIFNKAKYFSEQMKKMKQLNFNFINWVPQEYKVEDHEVIEKKMCQKGPNSCAGPARFKLKIQKYTRNERICERIYSNREDFVILQDQLVKLPVGDLCYASLMIENYIRSLSSKMKTSETAEADRMLKIGVALFYHQINATEKIISSVVEYSPSRLFYSSIIESLGREFIDGQSDELQNLVKCILNHPEAGSLALPLFNPNTSSVQYFKQAYETLTLGIGKYSPSTLLALYSKIDFSLWLENNMPTFDYIKDIFKCICNGLLLCGFSPYVEIYPVFEILKKHFKIILMHMFPELFLDTVYFLLNGIENKNLCIDVYYETYFCLGCSLFNYKTAIEDIETGLKKFAHNLELPPDQQMFVSVPGLSVLQIKHVSQTFHQHFMKKRLSCDLYKNYSVYIHPLGIFLAIISHSLLALQLNDILIQKRDMLIIWEEFHSPFWPWLHPIENSTGFTFPWADAEVNSAHYMFQIFTSCAKFFHEQLLRFGCEKSVLSYLWNDYVKTYVDSGHRHFSTSVCHSAFLQLPWHEFHPSANDIEGMCKILQSNLDESKHFLSKISLKIPWSLVMKNISLTKNPDYVGKVLATLGKLMIISQLNIVETEENLRPNIFKELESLNWHFLSVEDAGELLNLFYSNCDPLLFLSKLQDSTSVCALHFLKLACSMVPSANREEYSNSKSVLYVQKFLSALSTCLSKNNFKLKSDAKFNMVLPHLLSEVDNIICNGVKPDVQTNCALPLMKEIIVFLNKLPPGELDVVTLNSLLSWISLNSQSPLLFPCLKVSCSYLNSVPHIVSLAEGCISARFTNEALDPCETRRIWQLISSFFQIPARLSDEFIKESIDQNAFLALYCYILHIIPQSSAIEHKTKLLKRMIQWIRDTKLSTQAEAKFLLLWDKVLELSITLVLQDENQLVTQELILFCWQLAILAEDRSNSGFFGTIGFGQTSSLSVSFRFLCRVISAFLLYQISDNAVIRIEPMSPGCLNSDNKNKMGLKTSQDLSPSSPASKALENLKALLKKKAYAALQSQIDYSVTCISDSKYNFLESRKLLKYFAVALFPKESYLSSLDF